MSEISETEINDMSKEQNYLRGYLDGESDTLDKIRTKIEDHCGLIKDNHCRFCWYCNSVMGVREILAVIDKYRESNSK